MARSEQSFAYTPQNAAHPLPLSHRHNLTRFFYSRDEGIMRFVRYVSASAPGSRWDLSAEYEVVCPEGSSDDDDDEDEEEEEEGEDGDEE